MAAREGLRTFKKIYLAICWPQTWHSSPISPVCFIWWFHSTVLLECVKSHSLQEKTIFSWSLSICLFRFSFVMARYPHCIQISGLSPVVKNRYRTVPKFSDTKNFCCKLPKIQTKRLNLRLFCQNGAKGIANSEDPDQTAPLGAV